MIGVSLAIIGLGPFARHYHLEICGALQVVPKLIVDLEGVDLGKFPQEFPETTFLKIPSSFRLGFRQDEPKILELIKKMKELEITHVILSSEPMSHKDYIYLFHSHGFDVLCDKPLVTEMDIDHELSAVEVLKKTHKDLMNLYSKAGSPELQINLDLRNSKEHNLIIEKASDYGRSNNALPESLSIYLAGGNWYMPNEFLTREGHPFKYGYGTLFHTSFHQVDFITRYLKQLMNVTHDEISEIDVHCFSDSPRDVLMRMGNRQSLDTQEVVHDQDQLSKVGSVNIHYLLRIKTKQGRSTRIDLEVLTCGLSSRTSPDLPKDNYRGSGRVKTENIRLAISPDCFLLYEDIRSQNESIRRMNVVERIGDKLELSVKDFLNAEERTRAPSLVFNFFMGAHERNPRLSDISEALNLFEILIESNTLANRQGGASTKTYRL